MNLFPERELERVLKLAGRSGSTPARKQRHNADA
jgi:hypothetical protein